MEKCILLEPGADGYMNHFRTWSRIDMYPISNRSRMGLCILKEHGAGWINVSYKNLEQNESMYSIITPSRMDQCILLEPGVGWIYESF